MSNTVVNLYWCFPSLMNLHGERGSVMALERWASYLGLDLQVARIETPHDLPSLSGADMLFFGPCELREARLLAEQMRDRALEFRDVCAQGIPLLAVGSAGALFARHTECLEPEQSFDGLGLFPMVCKERAAVFGDDVWAYVINEEDSGDGDADAQSISDGHAQGRDMPTERLEIIGCQIQTMDIYLDDPHTAFASISYGRGNNGGADEGCRVNNAVFTNALGPMLTKNPRYALNFLTQAVLIQAQRRGVQCPQLPAVSQEAYAYEDASAKLIREYIQRKMAEK